MGVPKARNPKKNVRNRRAQWRARFRAAAVTECPHCHEPMLPHHVCPNCGYYRGMEIVKPKEEKKG